MKNSLFNVLQDTEHAYNTFRQPILSDDELYMKIAPLKNKARTIGILLGFLLAGSIIFWMLFAPLGIAFFIALMVIGVYDAKLLKQIKKMLGDNIVRCALSEVMELKTYVPDLAVQESKIKAAGLISAWNRYRGSDYVHANYKGLDIVFSDVTLKHETGSGKNRRVVTKFKGQWIICQLNKDIKYTLQLREKVRGDKGKSDVETENIDFNNKFQILCRDPHTVFYILTPHFMDYIKSLDKRAHTKRTYLCFIKQNNENQVHIALHNNRDLFEPDVQRSFKKEDMPVLRGRIKQEVRYITGIIDELLKNDYLFGEGK